MKRLTIHTKQYQILLEGFSQWLQTLGYAKATIKTFPVHIKEFLHFMENSQKITDIKKVKRQETNKYVDYLHHRSNKTYSGGLSASSINKQIVAINTFVKYLTEIRGLDLEPISRRTKTVESDIQILSVQQIKDLYEASYYESRENPRAMGARDRAILALLYGAGLRRKEATFLNLNEVYLDKGELLIKNTKSKKERLVPIIGRVKEDLEEYILEARYWFTTSHAQITYKDKPKTNINKDALILNKRGGRLTRGYYDRLNILKQRAGIQKAITPHILRHSIATHLLSAGLNLEKIAEFLGHQSLESTQIYTHIAHNYEKLDQLAV